MMLTKTEIDHAHQVAFKLLASLQGLLAWSVLSARARELGYPMDGDDQREWAELRNDSIEHGRRFAGLLTEAEQCFGRLSCFQGPNPDTFDFGPWSRPTAHEWLFDMALSLKGRFGESVAGVGEPWGLAVSEYREFVGQRFQAKMRAKLTAEYRACLQRMEVAIVQADIPALKGFHSAKALANAWGILAERHQAFITQLGRKRSKLGDDCWQEVSNPRPNAPKFLYRADSREVQEIAAEYACKSA